LYGGKRIIAALLKSLWVAEIGSKFSRASFWIHQSIGVLPFDRILNL
jgi:hypothetical protein